MIDICIVLLYGESFITLLTMFLLTYMSHIHGCKVIGGALTSFKLKLCLIYISHTFRGSSIYNFTCIIFHFKFQIRALIGLSSITKKGEIEGASRPLKVLVY
jgi:hypothetical protein